jgi:hypothetical protein
MAEIALWPSAGVGRGVGREPRATGGEVVLVSSTCCTTGPELEGLWIRSAVPEMLEISAKSGITSFVTTSSELVRGGGLTKAGRGEDMGE